MGDIEAGVPETAQKLSVGIQFVYEYVFLCFVQQQILNERRVEVQTMRHMPYDIFTW